MQGDPIAAEFRSTGQGDVFEHLASDGLMPSEIEVDIAPDEQELPVGGCCRSGRVVDLRAAEPASQERKHHRLDDLFPPSDAGLLGAQRQKVDPIRLRPGKGFSYGVGGQRHIGVYEEEPFPAGGGGPHMEGVALANPPGWKRPVPDEPQ
jgi:hypothetical protein